MRGDYLKKRLEHCKANKQKGVAYNTFIKRINRNREIEDAIEESSWGHGGSRNEKGYKEYWEKNNPHGISYFCFVQRVNRGHTFRTAVKTKSQGNWIKPVEK